MSEHNFTEFQKRLNILEESVRDLALKYAEMYFSEGKISKAEALEKGISKAELEIRNL